MKAAARSSMAWAAPAEEGQRAGGGPSPSGGRCGAGVAGPPVRCPCRGGTGGDGAAAAGAGASAARRRRPREEGPGPAAAPPPHWLPGRGASPRAPIGRRAGGGRARAGWRSGGAGPEDWGPRRCRGQGRSQRAAGSGSRSRRGGAPPTGQWRRCAAAPPGPCSWRPLRGAPRSGPGQESPAVAALPPTEQLEGGPGPWARRCRPPRDGRCAPARRGDLVSELALNALTVRRELPASGRKGGKAPDVG